MWILLRKVQRPWHASPFKVHQILTEEMPGILGRHRSWCVLAESETQRILGNHEMENPNSNLSLVCCFPTLRHVWNYTEALASGGGPGVAERWVLCISSYTSGF